MLFHWLRVEYKFKHTNKQTNKQTSEIPQKPCLCVTCLLQIAQFLFFLFFARILVGVLIFTIKGAVYNV